MCTLPYYSSNGQEQLEWRRSSRCTGEGSECVEIAILESAVAVRDSTDRTRALVFANPSWQAFIDDLKRGTFER